MSTPEAEQRWNQGFEPSCSDADSCSDILRRAQAGERISVEDALALALHADAEELFACADAIRSRFHPDDIVTYVVDRNINYSNICTSVCAFCAFYRKPGDPEGYLLSLDEIHEKVDDASSSPEPDAKVEDPPLFKPRNDDIPLFKPLSVSE